MGRGLAAICMSGPQRRATKFVQKLTLQSTRVSRTQELELSVSSDGGQTYRELAPQEYTFQSPGTTFEREDWSITAEGVTHLRLRITPDKGGKAVSGHSHFTLCAINEKDIRLYSNKI